VVPDAADDLAPGEDLAQMAVVLVEVRRGDRRAHAPGYDGGRAAVVGEHEHAHDAPDPGPLQGLQVDLPGEGVEGVHDVFDSGVAVDVAVGGQGLLGPGDQLGVGHAHQGGGVVRPGQQAQVQGAVVEHLGHLAQVADLDTQGRGAHPEGHLDVEGRAGGVHAAAHPAGPGRDVDGVTGVTAFEDDLVAPEQHGP